MSDENEDMSLEEAINAAMDEHEQEVDDADTGEPEATEEPEEAQEPDESEGPGESEAEPEAAEPKAPEPEGIDAPPSSLSPAAREAWKDAPDAIRQAIIKREQDMQAGVDKIKPDAERARMMDQVLDPYQSLFQANGGNAAQTINNLLQTATGLQFGNAQQKGQVVANIINQFGVDLDSVNQFLGGAPAQPQQQQQIGPQDVQHMVNQGIQSYQQQMGLESANNEVSNFAANPQNEFYNDVKMDMADILEMSANRGEPLTMEQAYDRACQMNPEIQSILMARQNAATPAKRRAASSISGSQAGQNVPKEPESIEDYLNQALKQHGM